MTSTNDEPLVSTEWLAAHLNDPHVKIIDASFKMPGVLPLPIDDFRDAHIPGAAFFDVDAVSDHTSSLPHMYPDGAQFARDVAALRGERRARGHLVRVLAELETEQLVTGLGQLRAQLVLG